MWTAVVKVGGRDGMAADAVAGLVAALWRRGTRVAVVHGGGAEASRWLQRLGLPVRFVGGRRVTDGATLEVVAAVLEGVVQPAWVAALQAAGLPAAGVSGRGGLFRAERVAPDGVDLGLVGRVTGCDTGLVAALLEAGRMPVVSPLARDAAGGTLNVNADEAAAALAAALGARLLLVLTDVPGLLADPADPGSLVERLDPAGLRAALARVDGGMKPKLEAALAALEGGVARVQLLDGTDPEVLAAAARALSEAGDPVEAVLPGTTLVGGAAAPAAVGGTPPADAVARTPGGGTAPVPDAAASAAWIRRGRRVLMDTYARLPVVAARGHGATLVDADGREWLDFVGGIAVTALGHAHPRLAARVASQAARLLHVSNLFWIPEQVALAERLARLSGMERWFFCNSGAEAVEAALKLARRFGTSRRGPECYRVVAATGSFHGRTLGALSLTGQERYRRGFGPLPPGVEHVPYGDLDAVAAALDDRTCAVVVEPIQGEGGVRVPPAGYLAGLRRLCDERGALLVLDEVQTGIGRTGRWFACQHEAVLPDVLVLAKGLGGGVPIGAVGARGPAASALEPGDHASTFGGNPLACSAALETLAVLEEEGLVARAAALGERLLGGLRRALTGHPDVVEVRGRGLLVGVQLRAGARAVADACRERGLLVLAGAGEVIRLLPPLTVTEDEIDRACAILAAGLDAAAAPAAPEGGAATVPAPGPGRVAP